MSDVTRILISMEQGNSKASDELLPLVYDELRRLAARKMAQEKPGQTLQATALVHEAWLALVDAPNQTWHNRAHFFGAAAEAMRRILIDRARRRGRQRRGSGAQHTDLDGIDVPSVESSEDLLPALSDALDRFAKLEPRQAELVKLRYFVGMKIDEAAEILGISPATAKRWWNYARAWLYHEVRCNP